MVHPKEGKQYKLRLIKGSTTVDVGFFDANSSLSAGAQTLDNGSWTVQLFEDNVLKQNYCTIILAAAAEPAFVNAQLGGSGWSNDYTTSWPETKEVTADVVNMPAGVSYGWAWGSTKPVVGGTAEIHNTITESGGRLSTSLQISGNQTFWLTAITPTSGNTGTVVAVYAYYARHISDD